MGEGQLDVRLVGRLRDEQRRGSEGGAPVAVEELLARHPHLRDDPDAALELIYQEVVLRGEAGEDPQLPEYAARFPALADRLGPLFEVHRALEGGSLFATRPGGTGGATLPGPQTRPGGGPARAAARPEVPGFEILGELGRGG